MKLCTGCKVEKEESCFRKNATRKDGLHNYCKDCDNKRLQERHDKNKAIVAKLKDKGCVYCGNAAHIAIDFHHIDPTTKVNDISYLVKYSTTKVLVELAKCEAVCSECHRRVEGKQEMIRMEDRLRAIACVGTGY